MPARGRVWLMVKPVGRFRAAARPGVQLLEAASWQAVAGLLPGRVSLRPAGEQHERLGQEAFVSPTAACQTTVVRAPKALGRPF